jgi:hypothetical protein
MPCLFMVPRRRFAHQAIALPRTNRIATVAPQTLARAHTHTCTHIVSEPAKPVHCQAPVAPCFHAPLYQCASNLPFGKIFKSATPTLPHCPTSPWHSAPPTTTVHPFTYPVRSCSDCGKAHVDCAALELQCSAPCSRSGGRAVGARGRGGDAVRVFQ